MKVIVCQRGARHRYMIPRLLEECDLLAALYTDSSEFSLLGKFAQWTPSWSRNRSIERLARRKIFGIPQEKIFSSDILFWQKLFAKKADLSSTYIKWGVACGDAVYSFYGEEPAFLESAKAAGKTIIVDVMSHPFAQEIFGDEAAKHQEYQSDVFGYRAEHEKQLAHSRWIFDLADILIAPSDWVCEGIIRVSQNYRSKLYKIPYGCSINYQGHKSSPVPGRLLFVGHGILGKGLHHIAEILPSLKKSCPYLECRVVGVSAGNGASLRNSELINFIGNLPMNQMINEYLAADVLIMPSLSEGQSGAVLEALSGGVPVVITRQSGVDIENGKEGFTFEAGDTETMSSRILTIIKNRKLREEMSQAALAFSETLSMENWKRNLYELLREKPNSK